MANYNLYPQNPDDEIDPYTGRLRSIASRGFLAAQMPMGQRTNAYDNPAPGGAALGDDYAFTNGASPYQQPVAAKPKAPRPVSPLASNGSSSVRPPAFDDGDLRSQMFPKGLPAIRSPDPFGGTIGDPFGGGASKPAAPVASRPRGATSAPAAPAGPPSNLWTPEKDTRDPSISAYDTPGVGDDYAFGDNRMTAGADTGMQPLAANDPSAYAERGEKPNRGFLQSLGDWGSEVMYGADKYVKEHPNLGQLGLNIMAAAHAPTKADQWSGLAGSFDNFGKANKADEDRKLAMEDRQEAKDDRKQRLIDDDLNRKQLAAERVVFAKDQARKDKYIASFDTSAAAVEKRLADPTLSKKDRDALMEERGFMQLGPEMWSQWRMEKTKQEGDYKIQMAQLDKQLAREAAVEGRQTRAQETAIAKQYLASDIDDLSAANTVASNGRVALSALQSMLDTVLDGEAETSPILSGADQDLQSFFNGSSRINYETWAGKARQAVIPALAGTGPIGQREGEEFAKALGGTANKRESARILIMDQMDKVRGRMAEAQDMMDFHDKSKKGFTNPDALADGMSFLQFKNKRIGERAKIAAEKSSATLVDPVDLMASVFREANAKGQQALAEAMSMAQNPPKGKPASPENVKAALARAGIKGKTPTYGAGDFQFGGD